MLSVILKSSIRGLGKAGEVAKVKPGYARYLLSDGKAVRATKKNMELLAEKFSVMEEESNKKLAEAEKVAESLRAQCLTMVRQASDDGKLFGSVTVRDIAKMLCGLGYDVHPKDVFFSEVIKRVGEYEVNVELHADLVVALQLHVVRNEAEAERVKINIAREKKSKAEAAVGVEEAVGGDAVDPASSSANNQGESSSAEIV